MTTYSFVPVHSRNHNREKPFLLRVKRTEMLRGRETLALLHGWLGDSDDYNLFFDAFKNTHNIIAIEHRGHGGSDAPISDNWTTIDLAHDICSVLDQYLEGTSNISIIASSLSSAVSLEIAHNHPDLVKKLVLISPTEQFNIPFWMKSIAKFPSDRIVRILLTVFEKIMSHDKDVILGIKKLKNTTLAIQKKIIEDTVGTYKIQTDSIDIPVFLIAGQLDQVISLQSSLLLNECLKNSTLIIFKCRYHKILYHEPENILKLVKLFLEDNFIRFMDKKVHFFSDINALD